MPRIRKGGGLYHAIDTGFARHSLRSFDLTNLQRSGKYLHVFVFRVGLYRCRVILMGDSRREKADLHPAFNVCMDNSLSGDTVPVLKEEGNCRSGRRVCMNAPHTVLTLHAVYASCTVYFLQSAELVPEATAPLRRLSPRGCSRASCLLSQAHLQLIRQQWYK